MSVLQDGFTPDTVGEYCFEELESYCHGVSSKKTVQGALKRAADRQERACGAPASPSSTKNCYSPSIECAMRVLGTPDHRKYLIDVCPKGCVHWWTRLTDERRHFEKCKGCSLCRCPQCGAARLIRTNKGIRGAQRCWFFFDAIHNMFLKPGLASAMLRGRALRDDQSHPDCPPFAKYKEYGRLKNELPERGFKLKNVWSFLPCLR